jgi:hypothetical protein
MESMALAEQRRPDQLVVASCCMDMECTTAAGFADLLLRVVWPADRQAMITTRKLRLERDPLPGSIITSVFFVLSLLSLSLFLSLSHAGMEVYTHIRCMYTLQGEGGQSNGGNE